MKEIIPDGFVPIIARRAWTLSGDKLSSINGGADWTPGEALEAECPNPGEYFWNIVSRGGMTLDEVIENFSGVPQHVQQVYAVPAGAPYAPGTMIPVSAASAAASYAQTTVSYAQQQTTVSTWFAPIPPPTVHLERGYGYLLDQRKHLAPDENCTCGIYAAPFGRDLPRGEVFGEVYLWGKVIQGESAHRAQFAYPKKFVVKEKHVSRDVQRLLESFGCEVEIQRPPPHPELYDWQQVMQQMNQLNNYPIPTPVPPTQLVPGPKPKKRWWNK